MEISYTALIIFVIVGLIIGRNITDIEREENDDN